MRIRRTVSARQVLDHWKVVERIPNKPDSEFRRDIRRDFPPSIDWCEADLEECDFRTLYLISSGNDRGVGMGGISRGTFRVSEVRVPDPQFDTTLLERATALFEQNKAQGRQTRAADIASCFELDGITTLPETAEAYLSHARNMPRIERMLQTLVSGGVLPSHPLVVADSIGGPFTIIDGCHRLVAHYHNRTLAGQAVYLGLAAGFRDYNFARYSYKKPPARFFAGCNDPEAPDA